MTGAGGAGPPPRLRDRLHKIIRSLDLWSIVSTR